MTDQARTGPESEPTTYNILFVCTGNTCRSPMAEAIARRHFAELGWEHVAVGSAGIAAGPDSPAAENAIRVAATHGLDLTGHRSRPLTPELIEWADLILVMGGSHLSGVAGMGGAEKVALVTDFHDGNDAGMPVEDPYGGDVETYHTAFTQLEHAVRALGERLEPIIAP